MLKQNINYHEAHKELRVARLRPKAGDAMAHAKTQSREVSLDTHFLMSPFRQAHGPERVEGPLRSQRTLRLIFYGT